MARELVPRHRSGPRERLQRLRTTETHHSTSGGGIQRSGSVGCPEPVGRKSTQEACPRLQSSRAGTTNSAAKQISRFDYDLDWTQQPGLGAWPFPGRARSTGNPAPGIATRFRKNYTESLQALLDRAKTENHKVVIVVFGLANIDAYLKARRQAEALRAQNPKLYPHFDIGERTFESLKPPYQKNMARLASMLNAELQEMVVDLSQRLRASPSVRLQYSDGLTKVDFSRLELIHSVDAWHPSDQGHKVLAEAAFNAILPAVDFLGIASKSSPEGRQAFDHGNAR